TFTISDGETVKVTLDKALEANKETEVKFTYKDKEFTEKVTYVTTVAQAVSSVSATNLKEITVKFDGTVDPSTAESTNNYVVSGVSFKSATLSDDKTTVTLLIAEGSSALTNQRATSLQINNVKNADGTKTFTQKVEFTPLDVAVPEVKEVKALGTKAFKVVFSEPVRSDSVNATSFRVDNNVIAASVKYVYPNTAIVTTDLTAGEHTLRVSNVKDFSGLTIVPVESKFTAAEDTAAPQVVSVKSNDLKEVTVEFDETIKSVASAYANVTGNAAKSIEINDNKVTLKFDNPLNYTENTIHLATVSDYSNNTASVDAKVTPTLDTVRPTVVSTDFYMENGNYYAKLQFSKSLKVDSAQDASNYVLKNSAGNVPSIAGINSNGNPVIKPVYTDSNKTVVVNLGSSLNADTTYTLTVSGVVDTAYVGNVLLPYTATLNASTAQNGKVTRVWSNFSEGTRYVYVQFNKTLATTGEGNALEAAKYTVTDGTYTVQIAKENNDINLISTNTVRIAVTGKVPTNFDWDKARVTASYIKDSEGKYFNNGTYNLSEEVKGSEVKLSTATDAVYATSRNEVKLKFDTALTNVNTGDFILKVGSNNYSPTSYTQADGNKTLVLKFANDYIPQNADAAYIGTVASPTSQDGFGNKVAYFSDKKVNDGIAPTVKESEATITVVDNTITVRLTANEALKISNGYDDAYIRGLFTVNVGNDKATINNVTISNTTGEIEVTATFTGTKAGKVAQLTFDGAKNKAAEAVTDLNGNALGSITVGKEL
ncbi:TPA: Ig-like domain-containing protein, partial [Clostridioides difficile]